jgi:hypothetical protein
LVLGYYSVHSSAEALARGEAQIRRIGLRLRAEGRLPRGMAIERLRSSFTVEQDIP